MERRHRELLIYRFGFSSNNCPISNLFVCRIDPNSSKIWRNCNCCSFQMFLPKWIFKIIEDYKLFEDIVSVLDDNVSENGDEEYWLFNPNWHVKPSIEFFHGKGPFVLTSKDHNST